MIFPRLRRPSAIVTFVALAGLLLPLTPAQQGQEPATTADGRSQLTGRVVRADGTAMGGATVVAYHLASERVFESAPTDAKGRYSLTGLPYGYFDVAVRTGDGLFVADVVVNVPPSGKSVVALQLGLGRAGQTEPRPFPGTDETPVGVASIARKAGGGQFWRSPKGIGILAGVGGAALLAIASGDDDSVASPSNP